MEYAKLNGRALINVGGADAIDFLQSLVTNDVRRILAGEAIYSALLSPRGKFLYDFFLMPWNAAVMIDCDESQALALMKILQGYKLRSNVTIEQVKLGVVALWGDEALNLSDWDLGKIFPDPRLPQLGWRAVGDATAIMARFAFSGYQATDEAAYDRRRLTLGVPDGKRDLLADKSLLMEWGFEDLDGVDFAKGCYVGQEVTARSKHRGQVRKSVYQVRALGGLLPVAGTPVMAVETQAGELRSNNGEVGLALLQNEEVSKAANAGVPFTAGDIKLVVSRPSWLKPSSD